MTDIRQLIYPPTLFDFTEKRFETITNPPGLTYNTTTHLDSLKSA